MKEDMHAQAGFFDVSDYIDAAVRADAMLYRLLKRHGHYRMFPPKDMAALDGVRATAEVVAESVGLDMPVWLDGSLCVDKRGDLGNA